MTEQLQVAEEHVAGLGTRLSELIAALGLDLSVEEPEIEGSTVYFNLLGDDADVVLNHKAEPVKSISFLLQTQYDHEHPESELTIKVDAEGALRSKEGQLEKMALSACESLTEIGQETKLEPLNPYDRRLVHMALQEDDRFDTESVGVGTFKSVIIRRVK